MRSLILILALFLAPALAQQTPAPGGSRLIVVMPFENASSAPGIEWIGESFPEVLGTRLGGPGLYVISRSDRLYAFERMGIPAGSRPSRATLYQIAGQMDVDYLVSGKYQFDGTTFTARAQVMDVRRKRLTKEVVEAGALTQLLDIQHALAWSLSRSLQSSALLTSKDEFVRAAAPVRLDALENYVRGIATPDKDKEDRADKLRYLKQAVRLDPKYSEAQFALGHTYFEARDYANAIATLGKVALESSVANEANFYLGLAAHYTGNHERAQQAFGFTARQVPLIEVYNNLGVSMARRGNKAASDYFRRAAAADPRDPDYRFNLAVSLQRNGDTTGAQRQLRDALAIRPQDAEAKTFLDQLASAAAPATLPLERIKSNYDETAYRQMTMERMNVREKRYSAMPRAAHAAAHVARGEELLAESASIPGLQDEAEVEFREAILLDPANAGAHLGLARVFDARNEISLARTEAQMALQLKGTTTSGAAEVYLLLAGLDVKQNRLDAARDNLERAERIEPANPAIAVLRRAFAARQGQRSTPISPPESQP
ncbi:MAG: tetratricopeptide repeat protein [Terriglobales bacterium]